MIPVEAYWKALDSRYTRELEEIACKDPEYAYFFARNVSGADIEYCQEKDPEIQEILKELTEINAEYDYW